MTEQERFDKLLTAMVSKPPLDGETPVREVPASSEVHGEGSHETRTPKGKSATTS